MDVITVPSPDCYTREPGEDWERHTRRMFAAMEQTARAARRRGLRGRHRAARAMRGRHAHVPPGYLRLLRDACDRHGVHLIADEIAVGFGRTGTMFACEQAAITPDFLCLSKGLTGGYLPLSVVLTRDEIYAAFYDEYASLRAFLHSHSYTGNALACTAALATLAIFARRCRDRAQPRSRCASRPASPGTGRPRSRRRSAPDTA